MADLFRRNVSGPWGGRSTFRARPFVPQSIGRAPSITGVSRDNTGNPLGGCTVKLFRSWDDQLVYSTISDGSGNFTLYPASSGPFYIVWYLAGSPDRAGTSVNTLVAA